MNCFFLLLILLIHIQWSVGFRDHYTHNMTLTEGYDIFWKVDETEIEFKLVVRDAGYVGFGLSRTDGMKDSDIMTAWVQNGRTYLQDRFATRRDMPKIDVQGQNWNLLSGSKYGRTTTLVVRRRLKTCGNEDVDITEGTNRLIWARGGRVPTNRDSLVYHGRGEARRGVAYVALLSAQQTRHQDKLETDAFPLTVRMNGVNVPADKTSTYWCHILHLDIHKKHHIVKIEPAIQKENKEIINHVMLYQCTEPDTKYFKSASDNCYKSAAVAMYHRCRELVTGWSAGGLNFTLPQHVGYPIGEKDPYFKLEVHYKNPSYQSGIVDNSGLRLWITPTLRRTDAGVFSVGMEAQSMYLLIPPRIHSFHTNMFHAYGWCRNKCLNQGMNRVSQLRVFAYSLHTHRLGRGVSVRRFRNSTEIEPLARDLNFNYTFQDYFELRRERTIQQDDELLVQCDYISNKDKVTNGGLNLNEEQCLAYLSYYPKIDLTDCYSTPSEFRMMEFFESLGFGPKYTYQPHRQVTFTNLPHYIKGRSMKAVFHELRWNQTVIDLWQRMVSSGETVNYCRHGKIPYNTTHGATDLERKVTQPLRQRIQSCSDSALGGGTRHVAQLHTCLLLLCTFLIFY